MWWSPFPEWMAWCEHLSSASRNMFQVHSVSKAGVQPPTWTQLTETKIALRGFFMWWDQKAKTWLCIRGLDEPHGAEKGEKLRQSYESHYYKDITSQNLLPLRYEFESRALWYNMKIITTTIWLLCGGPFMKEVLWPLAKSQWAHLNH